MNIPINTSLFYIGVLVPITVIVPISLALFKKNILTKELNIVLYYLFFSGIGNFITKIFGIKHINTNPLSHVYTVIELGIILFFYNYVFGNSKYARYVNWAFVAFLFISVINAVFFQSIFDFNSYTKPIEALLVIWFAISYLIQMIEDFDKEVKNKIELNYINSGFLLYFSGSFVLFTIFNIFVKNRAVAFAILDVHATLLLLMYALFTVALWKLKK